MRAYLWSAITFFLAMSLVSLVSSSKVTAKKPSPSKTKSKSSEESIRGHINSGFTILDSPVLKVLWCKNQAKGEIVALTLKGTVYGSYDHGFNWENLQDKMNKVAFVEGFEQTAQ